MRLTNWFAAGGLSQNHISPELRKYHLLGNVYGHPDFKDGTLIITSKIVKINDKGNCKEVITENGSVYELHKEDVSQPPIR